MQAQAEELTQDGELPHSAIEWMVEVVERAMGTQQQHLVAPETGTGETFFADIATLATQACQVVAFVEIQALDSVVKESENMRSFTRVGRQMNFTVCFKERGWLSVETVEMHQDWATTRELGMESQVEALTQEIVEIHRDAYYTLWRSQVD